jgi:hypothetical protein
MSDLWRIVFVSIAMCFIGGCYEDEAEITLNADGSGRVKQRVVLSDRFVVAN